MFLFYYLENACIISGHVYGMSTEQISYFCLKWFFVVWKPEGENFYTAALFLCCIL